MVQNNDPLHNSSFHDRLILALSREMETLKVSPFDIASMAPMLDLLCELSITTIGKPDVVAESACYSVL